jgi:hypothetical protein
VAVCKDSGVAQLAKNGDAWVAAFLIMMGLITLFSLTLINVPRQVWTALTPLC